MKLKKILSDSKENIRSHCRSRNTFPPHNYFAMHKPTDKKVSLSVFSYYFFYFSLYSIHSRVQALKNQSFKLLMLPEKVTKRLTNVEKGKNLENNLNSSKVNEYCFSLVVRK